MILPVSKLSETGVLVEGDIPIEVLDWPNSQDGIIHPASPLHYKLEAKRFGTELLVQGSVDARFAGICCRCGGPLDRRYDETVVYSQELTPEMTEVDLTSELRDAILLALPNNPVCSDVCAGLCPRCGKRLADGPCSCSETQEKTPWDVLDNLSRKE